MFYPSVAVLKLHRSTVEAVIQALNAIFVEGRYADKVIEKVLKQNRKWGARDRRFIAETTYDIVRWYRLLADVSGAEATDFWRLIAAHFTLRHAMLPGWPEFADFDRSEVLARRQAVTTRATAESIPDWLDTLGEAELGSHRWAQELTALNQGAAVVLRTNTLKTHLPDLQNALADAGVQTTTLDNFPDALVLQDRQPVFKLEAFQNGLFEVQDAGSQLIAPFLDVSPGQRVIDACAGAGGKTLHLASLMKNKGRLLALDVEGWKLDELKKRARRAGVSNLETRLIDTSKVIKRLEGTADRLLLDVPCSGLGVLRRNPDAKWKLSTQFLDEVRTLQQRILQDYSPMVKPGGLMVYATCSLLPSEDEAPVKAFLENNPHAFELVTEQRAWPSEGFDGFYMALLRGK